MLQITRLSKTFNPGTVNEVRALSDVLVKDFTASSSPDDAWFKRSASSVDVRSASQTSSSMWRRPGWAMARRAASVSSLGAAVTAYEQWLTDPADDLAALLDATLDRATAVLEDVATP